MPIGPRARGIAFAIAAVVVIAAAGGTYWWIVRSALPPPPPPLAQGEIPPGFTAVEPPLQMGALAFQDADGKTVHISDFRGRPVILNIWAKWCAPCVVELPMLNQLQAKGGTLAVVAVAVDEPDPIKVRGFLVNRGLTALTPYLDPKNAFAKALNIKTIPVSLLINKDGYAMVRVDAPVEWFSAAAVALLQRTIL
jgi:thiol-disulfide isomerase/thioredoxin